MLDLDETGAAVTPLPAATVIVARQLAGSELELFCVKRSQKSGFLGGAVVFPGGKVDAGDLDPAWAAHHTALAPRALLLGPPDTARGFAIAALRESLEEAAILPVAGDSLDAAGALELRTELAARVARARATQPTLPGNLFRELIAERQLKLDTARLLPLWRWTTPTAEQRRFDTPFYLLTLPEGQLGESDQHETTHGFWATPSELLRLWAAGEIFLAPPTSRSVEVFSELRSLDDAPALVSCHSLDPICPELAFEDGQTVLALPGDPLHSRAAMIPGTEAGPTRFVLSDGRFVGKRVARA